MSTFSSVARKPGQTPKPKVVPRRNTQRLAQKKASTATLTPESIPHSPDLQPTSLSGPSSEARSFHDPTSRQTDQDVRYILTPPSTALERLSPPPPPPSTENVVTSSSAPAVPEEVGNSRVTPDGIPLVVSGESHVQTRNKRRAGALEDRTTAAVISNELDGTTPGAIPTPVSSVPASKRRKAPPQGGASYLLSRPADAAPRAQTETLAHQQNGTAPEERSRASTEDLLQRVTAQFRSVSEAAGSIENSTRNLRPRSGTAATYAEAEDEDEPQPRRRRARSSRAAAIEQTATEIVEQATGRGRKRKRRSSIPEDPESHEIDVNTVKMGDLTRDSGLGKMSDTGRLMATNWAEIQQRWKERPEENRRQAELKTRAEKEARKGRAKETSPRLEANNAHLTGQAMIVGDQIVMDAGSRVMDFSNNLTERVIEHEAEAREVRKVDNYVNSSRIGKYAGLRQNGARWSDEATELFYKGLRMFGTDFELIATLFPSKKRPEIKAKYTREEKINWAKVRENLDNPEPVQLDVYEEMVELEGPLQDPKELEAELKIDYARAMKEAEERERQDGLIADAADIPIPSTEVDAEGNEIVAENAEAAVDEQTRRIQSEARRVIADAVAPKKTRQRRTRDTSKVTKSKKGKQTLAGVEERIGNIDEVER